MTPVGVKELKARLSEYLRLVRGDETVLVTDRDEVVAELRPTRKQPTMADSLDGILDSLAERGEVTRPTSAKATLEVEGNRFRPCRRFRNGRSGRSPERSVKRACTPVLISIGSVVGDSESRTSPDLGPYEIIANA